MCVPVVKKFRGDIFSQFVSPSVLQLLSHHNKIERDLVLVLKAQPSQGPSQFGCAVSLLCSQNWKHTWTIQKSDLIRNPSHQLLT